MSFFLLYPILTFQHYSNEEEIESSQRGTRAPVVQVHPRQEAGALLLVDGMALPLHPRLSHPARRSFWGLIRAFIH